ncbi:hypothetical protein, partial [Levilactobacillus spicheri]
KNLAPFLDQDDFKMVTFQPSDEAVVTEPLKLQIIKVQSPDDPEQEVPVIGNGNIDIKLKHIRPADIIASMNY